jgi:zona occludens toxin
LAEHRHFVHPETGVTCDLVVANQSITNLPRFIRDRIEITFKMTKLKMLGLNSSYRVEIYSGAKLIKSELTSKRNYNFDKKYFHFISPMMVTVRKKQLIRGRVFFPPACSG